MISILFYIFRCNNFGR